MPNKQGIQITKQATCWHTLAERVMWLANSERLHLVVEKQ